ncbi:phosphoglycerate mutase-like protein [Trichodelitschia bisporula]|uniref:Phosphoglycerate mutase-like protein n=1 Tax=Trichodelitschia bisporula TaxID=703511 RepID=A0A6G1HUR1_9PEZI|nr:phosphoglycerate mutase-like protein [Trichodelitschia bisporula]
MNSISSPFPVNAFTSTEYHLQLSTVTGFFQQDDNATDPDRFDYASSNLGLINRTYPSDLLFDPTGTKTQWQRFEHFVRKLDANPGNSVHYKVLFVGRHGEGYHNVAEAFYGTPAWNCYWSKLDGNGTITWSDAHLTPTGIKQALNTNAFWRHALSEAKIPAPEAYYTSPLDRCVATANLTYADLPLPHSCPFRPIVKELLREALGVHTCDRRSTRSAIRAAHPSVTFEPGFPEQDPLWVPELRESTSHHTERLRALLRNIFATEPGMFVALSSHSGSIAAMLRALGHRPFPLQTGGVIAVLVRADRAPGPAPVVPVDPPVPAPDCGSGVVQK